MTASAAITGKLGGHFARLARLFARQDNVQIVFEPGACPSVDVKTGRIVLPDSVEYLEGDACRAMEGFLDHEIAHIREEREWPEGETPGDLRGDENRPAIVGIQNVYEDVRIERRAGARWAGVRDNLDFTLRWALARARTKLAGDEPVDLLWAIGCGIICQARDVDDGAWLPPEIREILAGLVDLIERAKVIESPREAYDLAVETLQRLVSAGLIEHGPYPLPPPDSREGGEGMTGSGTRGAAEALFDAAETAAAADPLRIRVHPIAAARDRTLSPPASAPGALAALKASAAQAAGGLMGRLSALLRGPTPTLLPEQDRGWLDSRVFPALLAVGERRVFRDEQIRPGEDVAVLVLLDQSGSMSGARIDLARVAVFALGEVLSRIGIPFAIYGWTDELTPGIGDPGGYTRIESQTLYAYKTFAQPWRARASSIANARGIANNDDASALLAVAEILLERRERRRLLFILSDGLPEHAGCSRAIARGQLKAVLRRIEDVGIEAGGLGIQSRHVRSLYRTSAVAEDLSSLPTATLGLFRALLDREGKG